jgi:excisionase family DNA binding protein
MPDKMRKRDSLTTSQAAKLLSVSPDTVLKWVKAGKLKSRRTLGGHFRIPASALYGLVPEDSGTGRENGGSRGIVDAHQYCWEFLGGGEVRPECRECITYRSRAARCYQLKDLPGGMGCLNLMCDTECSECDYYRLVSGQAVNVLIIGDTRRLLKDVDGEDIHPDCEIRFVNSEYEAATAIQEFRPDYIVIDCALGKKRTNALCSHLFNDIRLPVTRIVLASESPTAEDYCSWDVFGWIRKPFGFQQLKACIEGIPKSRENRSQTT